MLIAKYNNDNNDNSDKKISLFEKEKNIKLPKQYRDFLRKYNGGDLYKTSFKTRKESSNIRVFYGIGDVKYSISSYIDLDEWINDGFLPIACDSFGNEIVIGLRDDNLGVIFFSDHEKGFKKVEISSNFIDFIKLCKSKVLTEELRKDLTESIEEREAGLIARGYGHNINDVLRETWRTEIEKYTDMVQEEVELP